MGRPFRGEKYMIEISLQLVYIGSFNQKSQSIQSLGRKESFSIFSRYSNFTTHMYAPWRIINL